ncbi:CGNR zinc finger domain-containing protein [Saccharopolyspora sp. HNM0983]|uniref:CGNR zinc finger domain-containing protein n=1 Tax=Saccharopolyspora montiporae TaxID=2781240 RepID=A0A929FZZ8_9PSEU|nr:CGNR zinc finger domain-containing protein [Saccharopolyspora sp. HNM0983]MBE9374844.1 CGNR zinc finger domain-containing protein [Saccharopolyspora sp. HNM0983]
MVFVNSRAVAPEPPLPAEMADLGPERDLDLVLSFLNTCDAEAGTDALGDAAQWRRWCADQSLGEPPAVDAARDLRTTMRESVACGTVRPARFSPSWPVRVEMHDGLPRLVGTDALGKVLVAAARLVHTGHWERLKICPAEDCLCAFYDRSRNRSRTWCSMRVCGNREKARSWRERHAV